MGTDVRVAPTGSNRSAARARAGERHLVFRHRCPPRRCPWRVFLTPPAPWLRCAEVQGGMVQVAEAARILGAPEARVADVAVRLAELGAPPFGPEDLFDIVVSGQWLCIDPPRGYTDFANLTPADVALFRACLRALEPGLDVRLRERWRGDSRDVSAQPLRARPGTGVALSSSRVREPVVDRKSMGPPVGELNLGVGHLGVGVRIS
jgi:hypothetical protein